MGNPMCYHRASGMRDNNCDLYTNRTGIAGFQVHRAWNKVLTCIVEANSTKTNRVQFARQVLTTLLLNVSITQWPFPPYSNFINHHHPLYHLHSPYKYLKSLSTLQLGWGQTSLVRCHSFSAPLLKEPDVVLNTSAVTLWMLKMFSWVFLTLFTFCSDSKLPLRCG